ncbi:putative aquaporin NIP7-1 [Camellia lanceoleosa]|uniref:Aquaporin NIP7-1 n=1 Tax=Camellia lanceoleosa TaxID=1840588 RepID=A0ACC0H8K6_9ERIC|nr:putative aquaporin NIP7-1 [Camellia lanceoleosa]
MKHLFEDQPTIENSNEASTSDQSKYDQEMGSNATPRSVDVLINKASCCSFPYQMDIDSLRKVLAEAMGTFILMFCICAIIAITQLMGGQVGLLEYAATAALTVVVVIFSIGAISGAHVNPSITFAFATSGQFPWSQVGHLSGFIVGTAIGLAVLISGPISGGSMNPARSLGPAIVSWKFGDVWIYLIAPTVGAVGGALLFRALRLQHHPCCSDSSPNTTRLRQPLH